MAEDDDEEYEEEGEEDEGEELGIEKAVDTSVDLLDFGMPDVVAPEEAKQRLPSILTSQQTNGLVVDGQFCRREGIIYYDLMFTNESATADVSRFAIQFNKNTFALSPTSVNIVLDQPLSHGESGTYSVQVTINPKNANKGAAPTVLLQVALKCLDIDQVFYWKASLAFYVLFVEDGKVEKKEFIDIWKTIGDAKEVSESVSRKHLCCFKLCVCLDRIAI